MRYRVAYALIPILLTIVLVPLVMATSMALQGYVHPEWFGVSIGRGSGKLISKLTAYSNLVIFNTTVGDLLTSGNEENYSAFLKLVNRDAVNTSLVITLRLSPVGSSVLATNTTCVGYVVVGKSVIKYVLGHLGSKYEVIKGGNLVGAKAVSSGGNYVLTLIFKGLSLNEHVLINLTKTINVPEVTNGVMLNSYVDATLSLNRSYYLSAIAILLTALTATGLALTAVIYASRRVEKFFLE